MTVKPERSKLTIVTNYVAALTLAIVPFHAFLTVGLSTYVGHFTLLRLWVEGALALSCGLAIYILCISQKIRRTVFRSPVSKLIAVYVGLFMILGAIALIKNEVSVYALAYSFILNLRFLLWMICIWIFCLQSDWLRRHYKTIILVPLGVTVIFGLLQFFILPPDFLKHFGYNDTTSYVANVTINQDTDTIRVQSFLRGSNPFGAYLAACGGLIALLYVKGKRLFTIMCALLLLTTLFLTFSRSAWLGSMVTMICAGYFIFAKWRLRYLLVLSVLAVGLLTFLYVGWENGGIQNAVLHNNESSTASITSNDGHEGAVRQTISDIRRQPYGGGPGTAGQPSIYNTEQPARNTESYILEVLLETGVIGLLLFAGILVAVGREFRRRLDSRFVQIMLASLIGMIIVNLFSYGWTDESVAFVWWGLAGIALAMPVSRRTTKETLEI